LLAEAVGTFVLIYTGTATASAGPALELVFENRAL